MKTFRQRLVYRRQPPADTSRTIGGTGRTTPVRARRNGGCPFLKLNPHDFIGGFERLAIACLHADIAIGESKKEILSMGKVKKVARKVAKPVGGVSPSAHPRKKVPRRVSAPREQRLSPAPLMQLATAFWAFGTLAAAVELDLFSKISGAGTNAHELTSLLGLSPRPAEVLLSACAALGLLQKREGRFHNTELAEEYLVRGEPYYFGGFVTMNFRQSYLPWHRVVEALKTDHRVWFEDQTRDWAQAVAQNAEQQRVFTEAMHGISIQSGKAVVEAFDFSKRKQLLDVGGGSGAYCIEAVRRYPGFSAVLFDTPAVLEVAKRKIADAGLERAIKTVSGDFFTGELPKGSDTILLSMILHDWAPDKNRAILRKCYDALSSGGEIIISELMMDDDKCGPPPAALMAMMMIIATEGRNYTWAEYEEWLKEAGFVRCQRIPLDSPGANGILVGRKP
jgi:ubiquinone/menaquinone biosynthesis C-methylase UbiE